MNVVFFVVVLVFLSVIFYSMLSHLSYARRRQTFVSTRSINEQTQRFLIEIAECGAAILAAALVAMIAVWYVTLFQ